MYKVLWVFLILAFIASFDNCCYAKTRVKRQVAEATYKNAYDLGYIQKKNITLTLVGKEFEDLTLLAGYYKDDGKSYDSVKSIDMIDIGLERIINKSNPKLNEAKKSLYKKYIIKWSEEYDLSPFLIAAIIHRESNFREHLVSSTGCKGPMQVSSSAHREKLKKLGIKPKDLHSINHGINVGCQVVREYLDLSKGNYRKALRNYLGGGNTRTSNRYVDDIFKMSRYALTLDSNISANKKRGV